MEYSRSTNGVNMITCITIIIALCILIFYAVYFTTKCTVQKEGDCNNWCKIPTVPAQSQRFSLANARANVRPISVIHDDFKNYKFDFNQTTGVHADWHTNEQTLKKMCDMLTDGLRYVHHNAANVSSPTAVRDVRLVLAVTENFIMRYKIKLDAHPTPLVAVPWGSDSKPFIIDSTCMLAHYLLLEQNVTLKQEAVELIFKLINSPVRAFNTLIEKYNVLRLVGPWILAKYLNGEGEAAANTTDYRNAIAHAKIGVRHVKTEKGSHMDHSFYDRNLGLFYKNLQNICDDKVLYYYGFDTKLVHTPVSEWDAVKSIILHPTVKFGNIGMLGKSHDSKYSTYEKSNYGVKVMPFSGYIRYFTKDRQFNVRAQKTHLAYYEGDRTSKDMAQYWVQYRNVHSAVSTEPNKFPDIGFINKAAQTGRVETASTQPYFPTKAKSFVVAYKHFGVMYQEYEIAEFGDFTVFELIVINTATQVVDVKLKIVNKESEDLNYYGANITKYVVPAKGTKTYTTVMNMKNDTIQTEELTEFPRFPYTLDTGVEVREVASIKSYMLYENDLPVVWMPYDWEYELSNLAYNTDGVYELFTFDTKNNQYMNVKCAL